MQFLILVIETSPPIHLMSITIFNLNLFNLDISSNKMEKLTFQSLD